jgi:probable H4MPT-linked C1 transfer pathway protein
VGTAGESWAAFDVGGANLKAAHSGGMVRTVPFELWRRPDDLAGRLASLAEQLPRFERVALTMTAELCDCFPLKREGVLAVLDAATAAIPDHPLSVWGLDARLHPPTAIRERPLLAAAANWLALACLAAREVGRGTGLLIDVGSTTTDLIPLRDGKVLARGRTDTERLQLGELVYAGVRRTPVAALAETVPFRGTSTRLMAELFATTLDVFLTLGDLPDSPDDRATADGRPATAEAARDRLARMVGADREGFDREDARGVAESLGETLLTRLFRAAEQSSSTIGGPPATVIIAGSGEFLARRLAGRLLPPGGRLVSLAETWGADTSAAACAWALARVAPDFAHD